MDNQLPKRRQFTINTKTGNRGENRETRKPYQKPQLISFGEVQEITLGPTDGIGESGAPGSPPKKPFGTPG